MSTSGGKSVAIYHPVKAYEGFEKAAQTIFELVREAQRKQPGRPRVIYLDIEGHRNNQGGFDTDMLELQQEFLIGFLGDYVTELVLPLIRVANKRPQNDEVPDRSDSRATLTTSAMDLLRPCTPVEVDHRSRVVSPTRAAQYASRSTRGTSH